MTDAVIIPILYIERKPHSEKYRVVGKGVTVEFLACLLDDPEWPVVRICEEYNLTPAEVYAAWAFYYDHQTEIDARIEAEAVRHAEAAAADHEQRAAWRERYRQQTGRDEPSM